MNNDGITVIADGIQLNKESADKINHISVVTKKVTKKPQINIKWLKMALIMKHSFGVDSTRHPLVPSAMVTYQR